MRPSALVAVVPVACAAGVMPRQQTARLSAACWAARQRWEYKHLTASKVAELGGGALTPATLERGLSKLGEEGWDFLGIQTYSDGSDSYHFKRPEGAGR